MANEKQPIRCPQCDSEEIFKHKVSKGLVISVLLLGFPIPFLKKTYHCFECNLDFKLNAKETDPDNYVEDKPKNMYDP